MPLPVLQRIASSEPADLLRLFHRSELHWFRHLGEEATLDVGTAIVNPALGRVWDANRVMEARLPRGMAAAAAVQAIETHYKVAGCRCAKISVNPAAAPSEAAPLEAHLAAIGWKREVTWAFARPGGAAPAAAMTDPPVTILPARASFRHAQALATEAAAESVEPQVAEAAMLHLDDPHYDALLAINAAGHAVGSAGVLAIGDVGAIQEVFVAEPHRRKGIGRLLLSRTLEICARSLFRQVLLGVAPTQTAAIALYESLGFGKVGESVSYAAPWACL